MDDTTTVDSFSARKQNYIMTIMVAIEGLSNNYIDVKNMHVVIKLFLLKLILQSISTSRMIAGPVFKLKRFFCNVFILPKV